MLDAPFLDLDGLGLALLPLHERDSGIDHEGLISARAAELEELSQQPAWVSDGSNLAAADVLFARAHLIVLMDTPWRVSYRILARHLKATAARNNRFPGWLRLYRFWRWSARYYADRNPHGLNVWGTPETRAYLLEALQPYEAKLVTCRSNAEVERLVAGISG